VRQRGPPHRSTYSTLSATMVAVIVVVVVAVAVTPTPSATNVAVGVGVVRVIVRIWVRVYRIWRYTDPNTDPDPRISVRRSEERQHPSQCYGRNSELSQKRLHISTSTTFDAGSTGGSVNVCHLVSV